MLEAVSDFVGRFGARIRLDESMLVKRQNRYFLLNRNLERFRVEDFFYAGTYLGKIKNGRFFPSFILLGMIAREAANKVVVGEKTEWLFVCGRDVFRRGITGIMGSHRKNAYTLILNRHGECLGFGRILCDLTRAKEGVAVENISDIGDFLRREK